MVRQTARRLWRSRGLTVTALLTLAIGIGASAAMFSVIDGVLLRPLPYPDSERLVALIHQIAANGRIALPASPAMYFTYREHNQSFESVAMWTSGNVSVTGTGRPEEVPVLRATFEFLPTLRVAPAMGRSFTAAEDQPRGARVVLLSHDYWQHRFGGGSVVGRSLVVDGQPHSVIGVLPESFRFARQADLLLPLQPNRALAYVGPLGENAIARLRTGVTLERARADVDRMLEVMTETFPPVPGLNVQTFRDSRMRSALEPLKANIIGTLGDVLWVLMGTVTLLLVIACVNVANLQLVRMDERRHDLAVSAAMGATRTRIAAELLFENLLLGLAGGGIGLALAAAGLPVILRAAVDQLPVPATVSLDPHVFAFTAVVSLVGGLLFGAIPVVRFAWGAPTMAKGGTRTHSAGRTTRLVQGQLLAAQVALALVLLVAAGLMARTFQSLRAVETGVTGAERILTMTASMPAAVVPDFADVRRRLRAVQDRLAGAPGVEAASFASRVPLGATGPAVPFFVGMERAPSPQEFRFVAPDFFRTMGIRIVAGRSFDWNDQDGTRRVAMVSESWARVTWGSPERALGQGIRMTPREPFAEVGVVGDVHHESLVDRPEDTVYLTLGEAMAAFSGRTVTFVVRSERVATAGFVESLQRTVWALEPDVPLARIERMADVRDRAMERTELTLVLIGITGAMAALLGLVGIYGVTSYVVSQRFREMGIRMALGAQALTLWRMLLGRVALLAAAGVTAGVATAVALSRLMEPLLFGVTALDVATYAATSALLLATTLAAGAMAARRLANDAPLRSLRTDG